MKFLTKEYNNDYPLDSEKEKLYTTECLDLYNILEIVLNDLRFNYSRKVV